MAILRESINTFLIYIIDRNRWIRVTGPELQRITDAGLTEYHSYTIQPYLLH